MKYCSNCGTEIGESDKFCKSCGKQLIVENKNKNEIYLILGIIIMIIVVTSLVAFYLFTSETRTPTNFVSSETTSVAKPVNEITFVESYEGKDIYLWRFNNNKYYFVCEDDDLTKIECRTPKLFSSSLYKLKNFLDYYFKSRSNRSYRNIRKYLSRV